MDKQYPRMVYSADGYVTLTSAEDEKKLTGTWSDTPVGDKDDTGATKQTMVELRPDFVAQKQLAPLAEGHTYRDRTIWQALNLGIKIDKRWSNETLLRKIAEYQTLSHEGIDEANGAVPDDQVLDYDPTISAKDRETNAKVDEALATAKKK